MTDEVEVLVELLSDVLGNPKQHYESKGQISFDCPVCAEEKGLENGDGKGNLEINYIDTYTSVGLVVKLMEHTDHWVSCLMGMQPRHRRRYIT